MNGFPAISLLTATPLAGGLAVLVLGTFRPAWASRLALGFSGASLLLAGWLARAFDPSSPQLQFVEQRAWIPSLNVQYFVGLDGLGLILAILTALLVPMALWASRHVQPRPALHFSLVLFLQAGLFGAFTALDFFHWFLFWELSLVPAFFLVRLWGGPGRHEAAMQFFLYTMAGSVALLLAFLALRLATGTFDLVELARCGREHRLAAALAEGLGTGSAGSEGLALGIFLLAFLGFAVKVPLMPFHTWLPATYAEAPTGTAMLLTGAMSKMGVYGFLRLLLPIFGDQMRALGTPLLALAVLTIVASAAAAFAQRDLKRMLAYSSVNHLGYCLLGVFAVSAGAAAGSSAQAASAAALNGVLLQMFNHGIVAATLFYFAGLLEERAGGRRGLHDFGGLRQPAPVFCGLMGIATFASLGLPGLNGFVGEFLIFRGAFGTAAWGAVLAIPGLLITAVFLLTFLQKVFHGPLADRWQAFPDLRASECLAVLPAIALMFVLGVYPRIALDLFNPTVLALLGR